MAERPVTKVDPSSRRPCFHCGREGHTASQCTAGALGPAGLEAFERFRARRKELRLERGGRLLRRDGGVDWRARRRAVAEWVVEATRRGGAPAGDGVGVDPVLASRCPAAGKALRHCYHPEFVRFADKLHGRFRVKVGAGQDPDSSSSAIDWTFALNRAVKEGKPADFSDGPSLRSYAVEKLIPRCRYLHHLILDDNDISARLRGELVVPSTLADRGRPLSVCSVGGGPGFDHIAIMIAGRFLRNVSAQACTLSTNFKPARCRRIETVIFDLYWQNWAPVVAALHESFVQTWAELEAEEDAGEANDVEMSEAAAGVCAASRAPNGDVQLRFADLRQPIESPANFDLRTAVPNVDVVCFMFVLHENSSSLLGDDACAGTTAEATEGEASQLGGAVEGILREAKVGALAVCADSSNSAWPALKASAAAAGWVFHGEAEAKRRVFWGPRSFVLMERVERVRSNGCE